MIFISSSQQLENTDIGNKNEDFTLEDVAAKYNNNDEINVELETQELITRRAGTKIGLLVMPQTVR